MSNFFVFNDKIFKDRENIVSADNRGLRYGDGLFETMKVDSGVIQLRDYHFERLFAGMKTLQLEIPKHFTASFFENRIQELCKKNGHDSVGRIRLMVFRGDGGLYDAKDHLPNYIIQSWQIEHNEGLNSNGLVIDVYPDARKSCDALANIKSNNFLPYALAALHAKKIKVNDCVLLNSYNRICDTTIANIFIIKDEIIYTPALSEGCIAGVIRRFMIEKLKTPFGIIEKDISINELENADEVFSTNSMKGIKWVKQFRSREYANHIVKKIFPDFQQQLI